MKVCFKLKRDVNANCVKQKLGVTVLVLVIFFLTASS